MDTHYHDNTFSATTLISTCKPAVACTITSSTYCETNGFEILKQQLGTHIQKNKHIPCFSHWMIIQMLTLHQTVKPQFAFYNLTYNGKAKIIEHNNTYYL